MVVICSSVPDHEHAWLQSGLGLAAEHGFFFHRPGRTDWEIARPDHPLEEARPWKEVVEPVMQVCAYLFACMPTSLTTM